jgi:hypothetical protein
LKGEQTQKEVEARVEYSLKQIESVFVESCLLEGLSKRKAPHEVASPDVVRWQRIIAEIYALPDELKPGELLTPREERFFSLASMMMSCGPGKLEGIRRYFELSAQRQVATGATSCDHMIQEALRSALADLMTRFDSPFLCAMTQSRQGRIEQEVHQTHYLKNMLAKRYGIGHDVYFDVYAGEIHPHLLGLRLEELITCFEGHVEGPYFLQQLSRQIKTLAPGLFGLLNSDWLKEGKPEDYWDEEGRLLDAGVKRILEKTGIGQVST